MPDVAIPTRWLGESFPLSRWWGKNDAVGLADSDSLEGWGLAAVGKGDAGEEIETGVTTRWPRGEGDMAVTPRCSVRVGKADLNVVGTPFAVGVVARRAGPPDMGDDGVATKTGLSASEPDKAIETCWLSGE